MTQSDSMPDTTSQPKVEGNTGEPSTPPVSYTSRQAWATVWRKLGRWLTLGIGSIILLVGAYFISHAAKLRNSYWKGYAFGRASFGYWDSEALQKRAMEAVNQRALDEVGLGIDDFKTGSGWYLVEVSVTPRSQPAALSSVIEDVDVTFNVRTPLKTEEWYGLSISGALTTHRE
jgi:hypothetical protein